MAFGDDIAQLGWRTGSVVPAGMLPLISPHLTRHGQAQTQVTAEDWIVVVSQTCDVVATKLEAEPLVELLVCRPRDGKPRKGFRNLESTRNLDYRPNREEHPDVILSAHAVADRYVIPRNLLIAHQPDQARCLDNIASTRVLAWYSLRAGRPSWPNEFVDRISSSTTALEDALDHFADDIAEVRVSIKEKDQELQEGESYHVAVFFVVDEGTWEGDIEGREAINKAFALFVAELNRCAGIEVNQENSEVVPGDEFTWQATKQTDLWNFANLSHRD